MFTPLFVCKYEIAVKAKQKRSPDCFGIALFYIMY